MAPAEDHHMARGAAKKFETCGTDPLLLVAVHDIGPLPRAAAYDTGHQLRVTVPPAAAAVVAVVAVVALVAPLQGVAAGDTGRLGLAVVGDTDLLRPAAAFDIDHPHLAVAASDTGHQRMDVQMEASSGGSFVEWKLPHGQMAWEEVCGPSRAPEQSWDHDETQMWKAVAKTSGKPD